ncbi:ENV2 protein, partial [Neopipo cinnamomea]|nr:ENV2 protein [Neopipo cinnamomea]
PTPKINPLWDILRASYHVLNFTNPNITEHCWLCYDIRPPFYEAIGIASKVRKVNGANPARCLWNEENRQGMTMSQVSGAGRCIG